MAGFHRPLRSATLLAAALLAVALAGCSNSNSNSNDTSHTGCTLRRHPPAGDHQ
jgi:outer membrane lipoprotein SlyB